jgi:protein gp37
MMPTEISWTQETWNPTTGCDRVSPGCDHCYALTLAKRLKGMEAGRIRKGVLELADAKYQTDGDPKTSGPGFGIAMHGAALNIPFEWTTPRRVFVNSMSDLFHDGVTDDFIACVFAVMAGTRRHTYQVLTKRPTRMRSLVSSDAFRDNVISWLRHWGDEEDARFDDMAEEIVDGAWPLPNVHLGTSVEDQKRAGLRVPALLGTPAVVRFLSCEPLLGPVDLDPLWTRNGTLPMAPLLPHVDQDTGKVDRPIGWVIVGGESGPGARRMDPAWARRLRESCAAAGVPFHFKQAGTVLAREWGVPGAGADPDLWPEPFPREYPEVCDA